MYSITWMTLRWIVLNEILQTQNPVTVWLHVFDILEKTNYLDSLTIVTRGWRWEDWIYHKEAKGTL